MQLISLEDNATELIFTLEKHASGFKYVNLSLVYTQNIAVQNIRISIKIHPSFS